MKTILRHKQNGLAAAEFIIVFPVLLLLLVGVIEIGNIMLEQNSLNKGVQNGARYAVTEVYGTSSYDQIADEDEIKNIVLYGQSSTGSHRILDALAVSDISVSHVNGYVTVSASYDYLPSFLVLPISNTSLAVTLNASSVMRTGP
ncbi:pilus assembly protein [Vibrio clamense]|uniref:TadE/TadG family type IV pilus assembly protein n=1 Tax=Vibrio clamense TaxID=2910254 RepID=UPI003D251003